jgi:predicted nuclease of predicted toxin-antitoxin system
VAAEVRYYFDEHVASAVAKGLRRRGIDVLTVPETRTMGGEDPDQLALANRLGRVFFTHDADHLNLAAAGQAHSGIVFASRQMPVGDSIRALILIHQVLTAEDLIGKIEFI